MANYFRSTAYHPEQDFCMIMDTYGLFEKKWQFSADLIHEGEILNHCVGRMGYDQKFAREETLIFFIRTKEQPDTPLVTVEYSPTQKKVLQCYGDHDSKPTEEILDFVHKKWLPYANKQIKQIAAA